MKRRVLFVDDDDKILSMFKRALSDKFDVRVALGPEEGLARIAEDKPFPVIVSDLKMPKMDGITFIKEVQKKSPNTVRVILTGYANLDNAMAAVNSGNVFRFLTKPCEMKELESVLESCIQQYDLIVSEKVLLEKTLHGCVQVLSETLALVNPEAFGKSERIVRYAQTLAKKVAPDAVWKYEVAAMLSQIGCVVLTDTAIENLSKGKKLSPEELQLYEMHPSIGRNLISRIPRMEEIAEMVYYQQKNFDGTGSPLDTVSGEDIPLGGRILKVATDFEQAFSRTKSWSKAFLLLEANLSHYDPILMYYLEGELGAQARYEVKKVGVKELLSGMIVQQAVHVSTGPLLLRKGRELTPTIITKIRVVHDRIGIKEPISVYIPVIMNE